MPNQNKKTVNILVLGAGGNVSIGIIKTLKSITSIDTRIFGACINKDAAGFGLCDYSIISPMATDEKFHKWLDDVESKNSIDVVLSGVEEVNITLAERLNKKSKTTYLIPDKEHMLCFSDKLQTSEWLKNNDINTPETYCLEPSTDIASVFNKLEKPFIIKPRFGKGSQGVHLIKNFDQFKSFTPFENYVAQEYIGTEDTEFTCGVYPIDKIKTEVIVMKRRLKNGSTAIAEVVFNSEIEDYCKKIAEKLNAECPFNIQLRVSSFDSKPYCFEINMRLSGTTFIRHKFGFPDCEAWLMKKITPELPQPKFLVRRLKAIRYEGEVFLDVESVEELNSNIAVILKDLK